MGHAAVRAQLLVTAPLTAAFPDPAEAVYTEPKSWWLPAHTNWFKARHHSTHLIQAEEILSLFKKRKKEILKNIEKVCLVGNFNLLRYLTNPWTKAP